jgi:uncharacterized protein (TIGR02246 family)
MNRGTRLSGSVVCLIGLFIGLAPAASSAGRNLADEQAGVSAEQTKTADAAALRALLAEFVQAFNSGDAAALAAQFTDKAQIVTLSGQRIEGRAAIQKQFAASFAENPGQTIAVKTEAVRFLGPDAAIEEGTATLTSPPAAGETKGSAEITRYWASYVKQDGKWLQDSIRDEAIVSESGAEETAHERLKVLEGLVGEWIDESDEAEVHTTCRWAENQSYLLRSFRFKVRGQESTAGSQRVGWDPHLKQIRSWVFDSDGGFSEGLWSRDGDRWVIKSRGVVKDGRTASATNILTFVNRDTIKWTSVDRTLGAEVLPDAEEITLVRKPPLPRSSRPVPKNSQPERIEQ